MLTGYDFYYNSDDAAEDTRLTYEFTYRLNSDLAEGSYTLDAISSKLSDETINTGRTYSTTYTVSAAAGGVSDALLYLMSLRLSVCAAIRFMTTPYVS